MIDSLPYQALDPLPGPEFRQLYLEMIFEEHKLDPQIGDTQVLANFALTLEPAAWEYIRTQAEALAAEALAAEYEILQRPELHKELNIPSPIRNCWRRPEQTHVGTSADVRLIRFDFHFTLQGWRISEGNIDTPGGWIEASGFTARMSRRYPDLSPAGDPVQSLAQTISTRLAPGETVGLIHASSYVEDRAMMMALQRRLEEAGLKGCLIDPTQLKWQEGQARFDTNWDQSRAAYLVRFFPAEWLTNLPRSSRWQEYFQNCLVPATNPTSALLPQSKRFPLVWDRMKTPLSAWRRLMPETTDPRRVKNLQAEDWVLKPIFGRAGDGIAMRGVTPEKKWAETCREARRASNSWIAQRRFQTLPVRSGSQDWYPCIGVYTVGGRAAGIYGRISKTPLTDETAKEVAVLISNKEKGVIHGDL